MHQTLKAICKKCCNCFPQSTCRQKDGTAKNENIKAMLNKFIKKNSIFLLFGF